jgi:hypothetical protein
MRREQFFGFCAISALTLLLGTEITISLIADRISAGVARARRILGHSPLARAFR